MRDAKPRADAAREPQKESAGGEGASESATTESPVAGNGWAALASHSGTVINRAVDDDAARHAYFSAPLETARANVLPMQRGDQSAVAPARQRYFGQTAEIVAPSSRKPLAPERDDSSEEADARAVAARVEAGSTRALDLQGARLHTDAGAAREAHAFGAKAFTIGRDVYFGAGQFDPGSNKGRALLAHELHHVSRQSATGVERLSLAPDPAAEAQRQKEARFARLARSALVNAIFDTSADMEAFTAMLAQEVSSSATELEWQLLSARISDVQFVASGDWTIVKVIRLVAAVSGLPKELSEAPFPSIGTELFVSRWARLIGDYLAAPEDQVATRLSGMFDAISYDVQRFGSVTTILGYDLWDTLSELIRLRAQLKDLKVDPTLDSKQNLAQRRELGTTLNRTARHALLLNHALGDAALNATPIDPNSKVPLEKQLAPLSNRIDLIRSAEQTEETTQKSLGATSDRLAPSMILGQTIEPEEAYPVTTDTASEQWASTLATSASGLLAEVQAARKALVPERPPTSLEEFTSVFDRWFAFLPTLAIQGDPFIKESVDAWRKVSEGLVSIGWQGWMANQLLKPVGYMNYGMLAQPQGWGPVEPPKLRQATEGKSVVPEYQFVHEFVPGYGSIETHAEAREEGLDAGLDKSHAQFRDLWSSRSVGDLNANAEALGLARPQFAVIGLSEPARDDWNYLVHYQSILDESYKVAEHKTMQRSVANYQAASMQLNQLLESKHRPKTDSNTAIGEKAIRAGGIEDAVGQNAAHYGLDDRSSNPTVESAKESMRGVQASLGSTPDLIESLEASMSGALAENDDAIFRIGAVLYMSYREHHLGNVVLQFFEPKVLAEAVAKSLAIQGLLLTLSKLGPLGMLFSKIIGKILDKAGGSDLGMVLAAISWVDDATNVETFDQGRAQAFFAVDVIQSLANFAQGKVTNAFAKKIMKYGNPKRWAPKTTKEVSDWAKQVLDPDQVADARKEATAERERLERTLGPDHPDTQQMKAAERDLGGGKAGDPPAADLALQRTSFESQVDAAKRAHLAAGGDAAALPAMEQKARADNKAALAKAFEESAGPLKPGETRPQLEFVPREQLGPPGTKRSAKVVVVDGKVTKVLIDQDASPAVAREEGAHVRQSLDPRFKKQFAKLDLNKPWDQYTPKEKLDAHKAAIEIEIAEKKQLAADLESSKDPHAGDDLIRAYEDINNLRQKQLDLAFVNPKKLDPKNLPEALSAPAELHAKQTKASLTVPASAGLDLATFKRDFEQANPDAHLSAKEIESLHNRSKADGNPDRVVPDSSKYDVPAAPGPKVKRPLDTTSKRSDDHVNVSAARRREIDRLLRARDAARRKRNEAEAKGDVSAYKKWARTMNDMSQKLGERGADAWAKQSAWKDGAKPSRAYGGDGSQKGDFDSVYTWTDKKGVKHYQVIEAKGGAGRPDGKMYKGKFVEQGTHEYFLATANEMANSSNPSARKAGQNLLDVLATGKDSDGKPAKIRYEKVQVPVKYEDAPNMAAGERSTAEGLEITPFIGPWSK